MKIDTRNPVALGMTVTGIVLILATLIFWKFIPSPDPDKSLKPLKLAASKNMKQAESDESAKQASLVSTQARLWNEPDELIAPQTLKIMNDLAAKHGLKVSSFRPQKEAVAGALKILPFFVSLDGAFPAVGNCLKDFEESQQTLIVTNVQIASSDQNTHTVSASFEVSAYIDPNRDVDKANVATKSTPESKSKSEKSSSSKDAAHSVRELSRGNAKA